MLYYECLTALDHGVYAADDIASPLKSGLLVYKGILGEMIGHHHSFTEALVHNKLLFKFIQYVAMHEALLETAV